MQTMTTTAIELQAAAAALAARDQDRARDENGVGYNATDTGMGHDLAYLPAEQWTAEVTYTAWRMLVKYRVQLAGFGIDFDAIERPARPGALDDDAARQIAKGELFGARQARKATEAGRGVKIKATATGFLVTLPYGNAKMVERLREIPTRRYRNGVNEIGLPGAAGLLAFVEEFGVPVEGDVAERLAGAEDEAARLATLPENTVTMLTATTALVTFRYTEQIRVALRGMRGQWNPERTKAEPRGLSVWTVDVPAAGAKLATFIRDFGFVADEALTAGIDAVVAAERERVERAAERVEAGKALDAKPLVIERLRPGMTLMPFQWAGVRAAIEHFRGRAIIGDEMGLGKTVQALLTVEHEKAFPALIAVPNLVRINWLREIDKWLPEAHITLLDAKGVERPAKFERDPAVGGGTRVIKLNDMDAEFMVVNYELLAKIEKWLPTRLAQRGQTLGAFVADEAHYLKEKKAQRTKAALTLAGQATVRLMLTGTAVLNRAAELAMPLTILGLIDEFGGEWNMKRRYCGGYMDTIFVKGRERRIMRFRNPTPAERAALHAKLRETCYIRRNKKDVLTDLPAVIRTTIGVPITNRTEYEAAAADVIEWARREAAKDAALLEEIEALPKGERERKVLEAQRKAETAARKAETIRRIGALRMLTGLGKIEAVGEWIENFMEESDEKLIVFAEHRKVQQAMRERFPNAAVIHADLKPAEREAQKDRFQTDKGCRLMILGIHVGGVGLTLTAGQHVAWLELPWRPADIDQGEGRAYGRLNDAHGISSYYLLGDDTFDEDLAHLLDTKREVATAVNAGEVAQADDLILADDLLKAFAGKVAA